MGGSIATGSAADMRARLKMVLPTGWFGDDTPVLDLLLGGVATLWSALYALIGFVRAQGRIATARGPFLDIAARDYFSTRLSRRAGEADAAFGTRIRANLLAPRATRAALAAALTAETGRAPEIFEPFNASDTGGYGANTLGYGVIGGYGNLSLPYQLFVTAYRPQVALLGNNGGYGVGPGGYNTAPIAWSDLADDPGLAADADIYAAIAAVLPTNAIAWTRLYD